jgi:hypothetical protein
MSKNDFVHFTIMRMKSVPSQRDVTSSVLSRVSPVPVTMDTEGYHVSYSLYCFVMSVYCHLTVLQYIIRGRLTKGFFIKIPLSFLFRPSQSRVQYTVPLLIFTIVTVLEGLYK